MQKVSGRMITGTLIFKDGKLGLKLDENQSLGTKCHDIVNKALPGPRAGGKEWSDPEKKSKFEVPQGSQESQSATSKF